MVWEFFKTYGIEKADVDKYDEAFRAILKLSGQNSRRSSYEKQFETILKT